MRRLSVILLACHLTVLPLGAQDAGEREPVPNVPADDRPLWDTVWETLPTKPGAGTNDISSPGSGSTMMTRFFRYGRTDGPRTLVPPELWRRIREKLASSPRDFKPAFLELMETAQARVDKIHAAAQAADLGFGQADDLVDLALLYGLAVEGNKTLRVPHDAELAKIRTGCIDTLMASVAAIKQKGKTDRTAHVSQGAQMYGQAALFDWLYDVLTPAQRKEVSLSLINYGVIMGIEGVATRIFWARGPGNWSTIMTGGAILSGLALRSVDCPSRIETKALTGSIAEQMDWLLENGMPCVTQNFDLIDAANGIAIEGPGYTGNMIYPACLIALSMDASLKDPKVAPPLLTDLQKRIRAACGTFCHVVHLSQPPPGRGDFTFADGNWGLTAHHAMFIVAELARLGGSPQWRPAAWLIREKSARHPRPAALVYGAYFDWKTPLTSPVGMDGFDPKTLPHAWLFQNRTIDPQKKEVGATENIAVWRQNWTESDAAAVMFKGGDKRSDHHTHLDVGSFNFTALGVTWAIDLGPNVGYPSWTQDGKSMRWGSYETRAAGHNTLVINPADNDYVSGRVENESAVLDNPDQVGPTYSRGISTPPVSLVTDVKTGANDPVWSASVDLAPIYSRMGVVGGRSATKTSRRQFRFERKSGALTVRDELSFKREGNEVWWYLHVPASARVVTEQPHRLVLATRGDKGEEVFLEIALEAGALKDKLDGGIKFGRIDENLPARCPPPAGLWNSESAAVLKDRVRKVSLHFTNLGTSAAWEVTLRPSRNR